MMPNLSNTVRRFEETMQFQIVNKAIVDGDVVETSKAPVILWFEGSLIPKNPRELVIKPEGQRKFKWWDLYTDLELKVDDVIKDIHGLTYRVMSSTDWEQAEYHMYELMEGVAVNQ